MKIVYLSSKMFIWLTKSLFRNFFFSDKGENELASCTTFSYCESKLDVILCSDVQKETITICHFPISTKNNANLEWGNMITYKHLEYLFLIINQRLLSHHWCLMSIYSYFIFLHSNNNIPDNMRAQPFFLFSF